MGAHEHFKLAFAARSLKGSFNTILFNPALQALPNG